MSTPDQRVSELQAQLGRAERLMAALCRERLLPENLAEMVGRLRELEQTDEATNTLFLALMQSGRPLEFGGMPETEVLGLAAMVSERLATLTLGDLDELDGSPGDLERVSSILAELRLMQLEQLLSSRNALIGQAEEVEAAPDSLGAYRTLLTKLQEIDSQLEEIRTAIAADESPERAVILENLAFLRAQGESQEMIAGYEAYASAVESGDQGTAKRLHEAHVNLTRVRGRLAAWGRIGFHNRYTTALASALERTGVTLDNFEQTLALAGTLNEISLQTGALFRSLSELADSEEEKADLLQQASEFESVEDLDSAYVEILQALSQQLSEMRSQGTSPSIVAAFAEYVRAVDGRDPPAIGEARKKYKETLQDVANHDIREQLVAMLAHSEMSMGRRLLNAFGIRQDFDERGLVKPEVREELLRQSAGWSERWPASRGEPLGDSSSPGDIATGGPLRGEGPIEMLESKAEWIIDQVISQAEQEGHPLSEAEIAGLRTDIRSLSAAPADREVFIALNNRVVELVRRAIERAKLAGSPTVRVRRGLHIPQDWAEAYSALYQAEFPWVLSGILQNAMLANPFAGERRPWKSR